MARHLPNLLSALRLLAAPLAAWLILNGHDTLSLAVFAAAAFSDAADGFVARRWGVSSRFGAWLDPAADKFLMLLCFLALLKIGAAPFWLVALVVSRDVAIALGWLLARLFALPIRLEPLLPGKASTVAQAGDVGLCLLLLALGLEAPQLTQAAALVTAFFTVVSAAAYGQLFLRGLFAGRRTA